MSFNLFYFYFQDEDKMKDMSSKAGTNSKLAPAIQDLVKLIFDIDTLKKTMMEFEVRQISNEIRKTCAEAEAFKAAMCFTL